MARAPWPYERLRVVAAAVLAVLAVSQAGCSPKLTPDAVSQFSTGITTAKTQTASAFDAVNATTSELVIDYAATQPTLNDENLFDVLDAGAIAQWERAFSALEQYGQALVLLTGPDLTKDYTDAAVNLANQIQATGTALQSVQLVKGDPTLAPGLSAAFIKIGGIVLQAAASHHAVEAARQADPAVRELLLRMADTIGPTGDSGIRGTVAQNWLLLQARAQAAFLAAPALNDRRTVVQQYLETRRNRDAQDQVLDALQRSLRALADAHHAMSVGAPVTMMSALAIVEAETKDTKALLTRLQTPPTQGD